MKGNSVAQKMNRKPSKEQKNTDNHSKLDEALTSDTDFLDLGG
jgi:hypothetical protein